MAAGSRVEKIQEVLRNLRSVSPDIIGSAMVSTDGFIIASLLPHEIDEELVSGMAAALLGVGERIAHELMGGAMEQTYVRGKNGYVILNAVGQEALLIVLTTPDAKLGLVFLDIRRRVTELSKIV
ncbi:roadblock/LC7 domain-containing protein [Polyangium aurulentum]|uniref:roadblock/LC7 domain-containing protein n=1 Tax=Polyangium aurulentum TaxID=2567896 RepID=UPI0010AED93F|nr:roadblock/LC7 domain-containing protein [Polyangium aurulentum]UQA55074.1 roadblock/LC7 domain-containing protein [Polyangium aurulentum]